MAQGHLLLILHAHLPYVRHPEFERFLEERWFFEAVIETYIPLIKYFDKLRSEGTPFKVTLSVSPPLANMMEDPLLQDRCARHIDLSLQLAEKEVQRTKEWPDVRSLAHMYRRLFEEARGREHGTDGQRDGEGEQQAQRGVSPRDERGAEVRTGGVAELGEDLRRAAQHERFGVRDSHEGFPRDQERNQAGERRDDGLTREP